MSDPILRASGVTYHYPEGCAALVDVSFQIRPGEVVGLVGPNGAGKSTLLLHLNGLLPGPGAVVASGSLEVAGLGLSQPNLATIRRKVGLVFQDPDDQLFCPTVLDDVAFGPRNLGQGVAEANATAKAALAAAGLDESFAGRVPHRLSVGERKRVCLAGVLACRPELLALDEPTSNLDPRGRRQLLDLLRRLPLAMLIATHDLEMVLELCGRVLVLDEGRLFADGPTRAILADEALMATHGLEVPLSLRREC